MIKSFLKPFNTVTSTQKQARWRIVAGIALTAQICSANTTIDRYLDTSLPFKERAADLVSRMTLEEKVPQLINDAPAIPRLGVREYNWWNEGLHGVAALGDATVFPQAIGMAATWNPDLLYTVADVISTEFRAKHFENLHRFGGSDWFAGLTVWSPNVNIFRDPRWGRGQETYGEDPYLTAQLGVAFVKGLQGEESHYLKTVATPKHYAVHSGPEATRHEDNFNPSAKDLEETYLPAFRATMVEAGARSIMCAYNAVDGVPACANKQLMNDILREKWRFDGIVVSDCGAVFDVYEQNNHGYSKTPEEGIKAVFDAGLDLICGDAKEANHIHSAVKAGLITEQRLDESLIRLFTERMKLGQFDPRDKVFPKITAAHNDTAEHRKLAQEVAQQSMVLLKNSDSFLPLKSSIKKILVTGPNADSLEALVGNYNGNPSHPVTALKGIQNRFGEKNVTYTPGTQLLDPVQQPVPAKALCVDKNCRQRGLKAEYFDNKEFSGPVSSERIDSTPAISWQNEVLSSAVRWSGFLTAPESGAYTFRYQANGGYRIWLNNELILDAWNVDWRPSIASGSTLLEKGAIYTIRIEAFQRGEQGDEKLLWSLPSDKGANTALKIAKKSDAIIFVGGLTAQLEGEEIPVPVKGFVGGDKLDLKLPGVQRELLSRLYATGKPVVVVLMSGSALASHEADEKAAAIVQAWYPGGQGGDALASLIAGDFSPSGKLPVTFYQSVDVLPPFKDYSMQNRTYKYHKSEVLYPFGHGLSYTQLRYDNITVAYGQGSDTGKLLVTGQVTNTGNYDADEIVQLYISHPNITDAPTRSLVGFQRVHIPKGQKRNVQFSVQAPELSIVTRTGQRKLVTGAVTFWLGSGQPVSRPGLTEAPGAAADFTLDSTRIEENN